MVKYIRSLFVRYNITRGVKWSRGYRTIAKMDIEPPRSIFLQFKIIFLTAKGRDVDIAKGMVLGADETITKPFFNQQIIDAVTNLLTKPQ